MIVHIRTGLEIFKKKDDVFCKDVESYTGDSESNETAQFLARAFQDLEDGKITSVLVTRVKEAKPT